MNWKLERLIIMNKSWKDGIRDSLDLRNAIEAAKAPNGEDEYSDAIHAIYKYKWYNWYQNAHVQVDSPTDIENTQIFEELEKDHPNIHKDIEEQIDQELDKLNSDIED